MWAASRLLLTLGAWAVERTGGFGHEPGYVTRWPIPEGTMVAGRRSGTWTRTERGGTSQQTTYKLL